MVLKYFFLKLFAGKAVFAAMVTLSVGMDWITQHIWHDIDQLYVFWAAIIADIASAVWRDISRGGGFQSHKLKIALPAILGYTLLLYILGGIATIAPEMYGIEHMPRIAFTFIILAHTKSFAKNMVIAGSFKKGLATLIYNYIDTYKNKITDDLYQQYADKRGIKPDKSDTPE